MLLGALLRRRDLEGPICGGRGLLATGAATNILDSDICDYDTNAAPVARSRPTMPNAQLKKGSAELLILSLLAHGPRHGYELSKVIESRSRGAVRFNVASLYPLLYKLERRGWVQARWVEKPRQRRRRYYRLTAEGRRVLAAERRSWEAFVAAVGRVIGPEYA